VFSSYSYLTNQSFDYSFEKRWRLRNYLPRLTLNAVSTFSFQVIVQ
jgi:hypothetical protein